MLKLRQGDTRTVEGVPEGGEKGERSPPDLASPQSRAHYCRPVTPMRLGQGADARGGISIFIP